MEKVRNLCRVDRKLVPVKIHFFLFFAGLAFSLPFRTVFAKQLGFSATAIGVIFSAQPFFRIVTNPLFGFISDYFKRFRLIISCTLVATAFSNVALVLIPKITPPAQESGLLHDSCFPLNIMHDCKKDIFLKEYRYVVFYDDYRNIYNEIQSLTCDIECFSGEPDDLNITEWKVEDIRVQLISTVSFQCKEGMTLVTGKAIMHVNDSVKSEYIALQKNFLVSSFQPLCINSCGNTSSVNSEHINQLNKEKIESVLNSFVLSPKMYLFFLHSAMENVSNSINTLTYKLPVSGDQPEEICSSNLKIHCYLGSCQFNTSRSDDGAFRNENEFRSWQFWVLFLLNSLSSITLSTVIFLMDAVSIQILLDRRYDYGNQRLCGTVGWGVGALAAGYLNQLVSTDSSDTDYSFSFYALVVLLVLDIIPIYQLKIDNVRFSPHILKDVCFIISKTDVLFNIVVVFFIGMLSGLIWNYQFWFMEEIGSSQLLLGLSQIVECVFAELPCFLISGWITKKIGSAHCNSIALLCLGLRYICYVFMYDPWLTLPVGLLHGPAFGIFYTSMAMYAKEQAAPGTEVTVQSLLHMSFEGLGVAAGNILGGVGFDSVGSRRTFVYAAVISFTAFALNVLINSCMKRSRKSPMKMTKYDPV